MVGITKKDENKHVYLFTYILDKLTSDFINLTEKLCESSDDQLRCAVVRDPSLINQYCCRYISSQASNSKDASIYCVYL